MSDLQRALLDSELKVTRRNLIATALLFIEHYEQDAVPDCIEDDEAYSVLLSAIRTHRDALAMRASLRT
jgi:hypothetical protein